MADLLKTNARAPDSESASLNSCPSTNNKASLQDGVWRSIEKVVQASGVDVLRMRFEEGLTLEAVGLKTGVTRERIRQIQTREIRRLNRYFKDDLHSLAQRTDELLDEHTGVISYANFCSLFEPAQENVGLMLALLQNNFKENVKSDSQTMIYRRSTQHHWDRWTKEVVETVISAPWPVTIEYLLRTVEGVPTAFVGYVLRERLGATVRAGQLTRILKLKETQKMIFCLRLLRRHAHADEIARVYKDLFGEPISLHNAASVLQRLSEALIVNRGEYCLYEYLWFDDDQIATFLNECVGYLKKKDHYVSTAVINDELFSHSYTADKMNKYVLLGIMKDDDRFVTRRGFMVALATKAEQLSFQSLDTTIYEIVKTYGPIGVAGIRRVLKGRRRVLDVTIFIALGRDSRILKLPGSVFNLSDRIFSHQAQRTDLEDAIRLCLLDGPRTVFAVVSMLRTNDTFAGFEISPEIVYSVVWHMQDVDKIADQLSLSCCSQELQEYKDFTSNVEFENPGCEPAGIVGLTNSSGLTRLVALDSRERDSVSQKDSQLENIHSILKSFGEI